MRRYDDHHAVAPPGVLDVLAGRRHGEEDDHVVAITVEGGGMRGVVSGAMLIALRELGMTDHVDRIYGASSGGMNVAYFAAGAGWDALAVYYDHLVDGFVRRFPRPGRPMLDMGRVEEAMRQLVPIDVAGVSRSTVDARLVLSDVDLCRPVVVRARDTGERLVEHLLAGAWLPVLAGAPYRCEGRTFLDGGLLWPDPLYAALAEGASHVLMLTTSTAGPPRTMSWASAALLTAALDRWSSGLGTAFREGSRRWLDDQRCLRPDRDVRIGEAAVLRVQCPSGAHAVRRLTVDRAALLDGARAGHEHVRRLFGAPTQPGSSAVVA